MRDRTWNVLLAQPIAHKLKNEAASAPNRHFQNISLQIRNRVGATQETQSQHPNWYRTPLSFYETQYLMQHSACPNSDLHEPTFAGQQKSPTPCNGPEIQSSPGRSRAKCKWSGPAHCAILNSLSPSGEHKWGSQKPIQNWMCWEPIRKNGNSNHCFEHRGLRNLHCHKAPQNHGEVFASHHSSSKEVAVKTAYWLPSW